MSPKTDSETKDLIAAGRAEIKKLNAAMNEITVKGFKMQDGSVVVDPAARTEFKRLLGQAEEFHSDIAMLEKKQRIAGEDEPAGDGPAGLRGMFPGHAGWTPEAKSLGERFTSSTEFKDRRPNGDMSGAFHVEGDILAGGDVEMKDIHSGSIGTFTHPGFGRVERAPMVATPMRQWRVRSLFPAASTNAVMIEYVEELGFVDPADNAAATVAEYVAGDPGATPPTVGQFGLKPKSDLNFATKNTPVRTIAHWIPAHRNVLDDEPQLRSIIDSRLTYGLQLAEDAQLLDGDGNGENLKGILRYDSIQQYPGAGTPPTSDTYVDAIRRSITRVQLAEYEATGVVVNPLDWERMELQKDADGRYIVTASVVTGAQQRLWQLPVVATPAMPEGRALVGAFGLGAQVYDRMQSNIRTSEHHEDFFVRNAIVVLCEERLALAVFRPQAFVEVNLETAGPATV